MARRSRASQLWYARGEFVDRMRRGDSYGLLLVLILAAYIAIALFERSPWERFLISILLGLVVLLTLHTSHVRALPLRVGIGLVLIVELSVFVQALIGREGNDGSAYVMFVLLLMAPIVILSRILRHEVVGVETILGAICIYVLLGIGFAGIYAGINDFEAAGFFAQPGPKSNVDYLYFSFVTITTVGFGDLTAGTDVGRVVVTFEALIGQVFLVTLVARLVSMYGTARRPPDETDA
jgi:Ion channel